MHSKKILVTGGAGYIGSKISHDLIHQGYKVYIIDNLSTGIKKNIPKNCKFFKFNLLDKKKLKFFFDKFKIHDVIHLAASTSVTESEINPQKYYKNNVIVTQNIIELNKKYLKRFVFSSTCAVYDVTSNHIVSEKSETFPSSVYGNTKLLSELLIKKYSNEYNFKYANLRYFNVAGCDENENFFYSKTGPLFNNIAKAIKNNSSIEIYGNNFETIDGTAVRDYIYLGDISKMHLKVLKIISKKSHTMNLGYGLGVTVNQVVKSFEKIFKKKIKLIIRKRRPGEMEKIIANSNKMKRLLNFKVRKNILDIMVKNSRFK